MPDYSDLNPDILKPGLTTADGANLKPSLVTPGYSGGTPTAADQIKPSLRNADGSLKAGLVLGSVLKPSLLAVGGGGGLVLDSLSPAAAYSPARWLISSYSGPCMKVRRDSDNALLDIGFSAGVLDEAALVAHCGAGIGYVHTLYDQSGNGRHLVQATAGAQWRIYSSSATVAINGRPVCWSTGTGQAMECPSGFTYTELSACNVAQFTLDSACVYQFANAGVGGAMLRSTTLQVMAHTSQSRATKAVALDTFHQISSTITAATRRLWIDGVLGTDGTEASDLNETNAKLSVGSQNVTYGYADMAGYFGDQVFFTRAIADGERVAIQADQKLFFGTP